MINNTVKDYLNNLMIHISGGVEYIRDFKDEQKWISTNSKMSIPGQKGNLTETVKEITVKPFLIAKYPVTKTLYEFVLNKESTEFESESIPIVNVSWFEAISFCNILSKKCGLNEYYTFELNGESDVICNLQADGYRLPQMQNGSMHAKQNLLDIYMEKLIRLLSTVRIPKVRFMK